MTEVKTFKIEKKLNGVEDLYKWLRENVDSIEKLTDLQIQKPLKQKSFCLTAKEKITERQIVIFASERNFPESLGELIVFAGAYDADIVIFLLQKINQNYLMPINWLHKICAEDYQIFVGQVDF